MPAKLGCIALLLMITNISLLATAQNKPSNEYQLKAAFIYNFTRFVAWPPSSFSNAADPLVIGILGEDYLSENLSQLVKGEKIEERPIIVKRFKTIDEVKNCHILFIADQWINRMRNMIAAINQQNTITVSDAPNFAKLGGMIGFYQADHKLRLQINLDEVKLSDLNFSSKLLSVSNIYSTK